MIPFPRRLASLTALLVPLFAWAANYPDEPDCKDPEYAAKPENKCECDKENSGGGDSGPGGDCGCGDEPANSPSSAWEKTNSLGYSVRFGGIPFEAGLNDGLIYIHETTPTPTQFTPQVVRYSSIMSMKIGNRSTPVGSTWNVTVSDRSGLVVTLDFALGTSLAYAPHGRYALRLLSASRTSLAAGTSTLPTYVRLEEPSGAWTELEWTTGTPVRHQTHSGRIVDLQSLPEAVATRVITSSGVLRQVKAAAGLADFVQTTSAQFEIRFYTPSQVGTFNSSTGLYPLSGSAFRVVRVENASSTSTAGDHVKITEFWGTREKVSLFDYDFGLKEWRLTQGDFSVGGSGVRRYEVKDVSPGPSLLETTITWRLKNEANQVISTRQSVLKNTPWGASTVREINEPATLNLVTITRYHEIEGQLGYGRAKDIQYPDGYWESYTYDANGRVTQTLSPWKDSALSSAYSNGSRRIHTRSFASLDSADVVSNLDPRPRTETESVVLTSAGTPIVTKRTFYVYKTDSAGIHTQIEEKAATATAAFGASGNLRTTWVYHTTKSTESGYDAESAGRLRYIDRPDGTRTTYSYTRNTSDLNAYWTVSEVLATPASPLGSDGLSMRKDKIHDSRGFLVKTESYIRSASTWYLVSTETHTVNDEGFTTATYRDGRQTYGASYDAHFKVSETGEDGVVTTSHYDALGKIDSETRVGVSASSSYAAQSDIVTTYERELGGLDCGCDGEVLALTSGGSLSLSTQVKKDSTGRLTYRKDAAGLETSYSYSLGGRQTTKTNPDGGTEISLSYYDRRLASVTGTAVVGDYFDYGVNSDGSTWTKVSKLSSTGARWEKTTANHLGQVVMVERPAYDGGVLTATYAYNSKGQRWRERQRHWSGATETTLIADTLTEYDVLGHVSRTGLDVGGTSGTLDISSSDRVTDIVYTFALYDSVWWRVVQTKVYPTLNSSTVVQVSENRTRLSGYTSTLASETKVLDIDGNMSSRRIEIDFSGKLVTTTETFPDSSLSAVGLVRNGRLVSQTSKSVSSPVLYGYDALGRPVSIKDPRHSQASTLVYSSTSGLLSSRSDAANNTTTYSYYSNGETGAGRIKSETNALNNAKRYTYDMLGRVTKIWGAAEYPQVYSYSSQGELQTLTTWRDSTANFSATTWPSPSGGDATTWTYQASTGLLTRKEYADGKGTDYAYDKLNRPYTRTWARTESSSSLITTYGYVPASGEPQSISYTGATVDISAGYDRLGRLDSVTDATGTRNFAYDPSTLRLAGETLPAYFGDRVLSLKYQGSGSGKVPGRLAGFELGVISDLDRDHIIEYRYDAKGRLDRVSAFGGNYEYAYVQNGSGVNNSDLLASMAGPAHTVSQYYEPDREFVESVDNQVGLTSISTHYYTMDEIGQRIERDRWGSAFPYPQLRYDDFYYNSRGELDSSYLDLESIYYDYDNIGNRYYYEDDVYFTGVDYVRNSLNQYESVDDGYSVRLPDYDFDGNQTADGAGRECNWDGENRLLSVVPLSPVSGDKKVLNTYDYQSRRVRRQVSTYSSGAWSLTSDEKFIYDGWNVIAVLSWNASTSSFDLKKTLAWGLDTSNTLQGAGGVGGLLASKEGSSVYHYTYDGNGNVSEVLDPSGAVVAHYEYGPFGENWGSTGSYAASNEFRFSTKPWDEVGDVYYYGFRYYSPNAGRWLSRDPIGEMGGINIYAFVGNEPISWIDPLGLYERPGSGGVGNCLSSVLPSRRGDNVRMGNQNPAPLDPKNVGTPVERQEMEDYVKSEFERDGCSVASGQSDCKKCDEYYVKEVSGVDSKTNRPNYHVAGNTNCGRGGWFGRSNPNEPMEFGSGEPDWGGMTKGMKDVKYRHYCCPKKK